MRKYTLSLTLILFHFFSFSQTDLVLYNFNYCNTIPFYVFPGFNATPVTTTAQLSTGCSLGCATGCGVSPDCLVNTSFITKSWATTNVDFTKYYEFTISTAPSVSFYLTQFSFGYRRSNTGPLNFSVYVNGVMKAISSLSGTNCNSFGVGLNELYTGSTTFRIYFWNGTLDGTIRLDNFKITYSFTTLPIELVYFSGYLNNNKVDLEWMTASELNNSHFEIEKSSDGFDFANIGTISSVGNSQQNTMYYYTDFDLDYNQIIFYRLKQVDYDGQFTYSPIIAINNKFNGIINQNGVLSLINPQDYIIASIYDISGKFIHDLTSGGIRLNAGVYIVKFNNDYTKVSIE